MRTAALFFAAALACSAPPQDRDSPVSEEGDPETVLATPVDEPAPAPTAPSDDPAASTDEPAEPANPDAVPAPQPGDPPGEGTTSRPTTLTERHDFGRRTARFDLPGRLDEVSGLAFSPDGRLFAHDDERGRVHQIDPATGEVGKRWDLGAEMVRDDFEGLAIVGDRFFLVSSIGFLYEFREVGDRQVSRFRRTDTGLGARCEIEGLDYDSEADALLFACKTASRSGGMIVIHRIPIDPARPALDPILVAKSALPALGLDDSFDPSGLALDPTGSIVLVSGRQEAILEIDRAGRPLSGLELSRDRHPQTEGVAFGPDGTLYLADEKNDRDARLTVYARLPEGGEGLR